MEKAILDAVSANSFNDARRVLRRPVRITTTLRSCAAGKIIVELTDISELGCKVVQSPHLAVGAYLMLSIPTFSALGATVVWSDDESMGLRFTEKLHAAIVEHIVNMSIN